MLQSVSIGESQTLFNSIMSNEDEIDFENWEEAADQVITQQKEESSVVVDQTKTDRDAEQQQTQSQKQEEAKLTLKDKIKQFRDLTPEQLEKKFAQNNDESLRTVSIGTGKVLKNDKDFSEIAQLIAEKLSEGINPEQTIDDDNVATFFEELALYLYSGLRWENYFELIKKIKVVKKERKDDEKKMQKQKQKKRNKKQEEQTAALKVLEKSNVIAEKPKDDLFGGATLINSKQEEEERKKAVKQKQEEQKQAPPAEDDDDFM